MNPNFDFKIGDYVRTVRGNGRIIDTMIYGIDRVYIIQVEGLQVPVRLVESQVYGKVTKEYTYNVTWTDHNNTNLYARGLTEKESSLLVDALSDIMCDHPISSYTVARVEK